MFVVGCNSLVQANYGQASLKKALPRHVVHMRQVRIWVNGVNMSEHWESMKHKNVQRRYQVASRRKLCRFSRAGPAKPFRSTARCSGCFALLQLRFGLIWLVGSNAVNHIIVYTCISEFKVCISHDFLSLAFILASLSRTLILTFCGPQCAPQGRLLTFQT